MTNPTNDEYRLEHPIRSAGRVLGQPVVEVSEVVEAVGGAVQPADDH